MTPTIPTPFQQPTPHRCGLYAIANLTNRADALQIRPDIEATTPFLENMAMRQVPGWENRFIEWMIFRADVHEAIEKVYHLGEFIPGGYLTHWLAVIPPGNNLSHRIFTLWDISNEISASRLWVIDPAQSHIRKMDLDELMQEYRIIGAGYLHSSAPGDNPIYPVLLRRNEVAHLIGMP